jgi:molybdate transport system substrate-binding protein
MNHQDALMPFLKGIEMSRPFAWVMFLIAIVAVPSAPAWGQTPGKPTEARPAITLTVGAAASLADAFNAIGKRFEAQNPEVRLRFTFAASGVLLHQIINGAPIDVFASADVDTVDRGVRAGVLQAETRRTFARNALVMVVPSDVQNAPMRIEDLLLETHGRVAIGKPATVPAGRYAREALESAKVWTGLQRKLVYADNVRQVLDYVSRGEVAAGFVYQSDVLAAGNKVKKQATVTGHSPILYPVVVTTESRNKKFATTFVQYLESQAARELLKQYGFVEP